MKKIGLAILVFVFAISSSCEKNKDAINFAEGFYTAMNAENYVLLTSLIDDNLREDGSSMALIKKFVIHNGEFGKIESKKMIKLTEKEIDGVEYYFLKYKIRFENKTLLEDITVVYSNDKYAIKEFSYDIQK